MIISQIQRSENMIVKNMTGGTTRWVGVLLLSISLLLVSTTGWGADLQFEWPDYRSPLRQRIRVFQYGKFKIESPTIAIDLPDHFLKDHKEIILVIDLVSRTRNYGTKKAGFKDFKPKVRVNNAKVKRYRIPTKALPRTQTREVKIKRKDLQAGRNTFTMSFKWNKRGVYCSAKGCGYEITKMSFKDAPPVGYTLQISSNPSGAKIFLQDTYKGTTPLKITDLEKQTYRIRIEKAGYNPIEDKIVFMRDAARIYDLRPLRLQEELLLTPQEELTQQEELLTPQEEALLRQQEEKILKRIEELQQQRTQEQALKQGPGEEKEAIPEGMVKIPAGRFIMGSSVSNVQAAFEECDQRKGKGKCRKSLFKSQMPQHEVYIDEFYIDKYEVTVGDYKKFAQVRDCGGMNKRGDNYPAACVTWDEARSYCRKSGKRLPTEAQWEKASRGGLEGKKYPWGDSIDPSKANYDSDGPKPVGNYEPNEYGVYDMAGNVMEWVDDWVEEDYYQNSPIYNPARRMGVRNTLGKIIRGGAWDSWDSLLWTSFRNGAQPTFWRHNLGFRCAKKE